MLGVDKRDDGGDQNADVIIIAHLDLVNHRLAGVSLPRDLLVEIPGRRAKTRSTVRTTTECSPARTIRSPASPRFATRSNRCFGIPIDGYVLVDFSGFSNVVDAMGGITVDVPYEIVDDEYPTEDYGVTTIHFDPGVQEMDGEQALIYVRTRHADSDDARRQRQLDVIRAIFDAGQDCRIDRQRGRDHSFGRWCNPDKLRSGRAAHPRAGGIRDERFRHRAHDARRTDSRRRAGAKTSVGSTPETRRKSKPSFWTRSIPTRSRPRRIRCLINPRTRASSPDR